MVSCLIKKNVFLCKMVVTIQMNQTRSVKKIIKQRKTKKYVSFVMKKSERNAEDSVWLPCDCRTRSLRKDINLFYRTMDLPKLFIGILKNLFVVYFFMDKYSTNLKEFFNFSFLRNSCPDFFLTLQCLVSTKRSHILKPAAFSCIFF